LRDDKEILDQILERIRRIQEYTTEGKDAFLSDTKTQDAVLRNLQVIGDAIKDLSEQLKLKHPDVQWREAAAFRNEVTHRYWKIDYSIVWRVVQDCLSPMRQQIEDIHSRLIYRVPEDRDRPSRLEEKLRQYKPARQ
jgi:uncharacterized protein with HEPN domain